MVLKTNPGETRGSTGAMPSSTGGDIWEKTPTAIDVVIRDLREIEAQWGTAVALERLAECRSLLLAVYETFSIPG